MLPAWPIKSPAMFAPPASTESSWPAIGSGRRCLKKPTAVSTAVRAFVSGRSWNKSRSFIVSYSAVSFKCADIIPSAPCSRQQTTHGGQQIIRLDRLRLEGVCALRERERCAARAVACDDDDGRRSERLCVAYVAEQMRAVGCGHVDVRDDQIGAQTQGQLITLHAVFSRRHI